MPKVLNKYIDPPSQNAVCIMRSTKWGNPYIIGPDGNREDVVNKHKQDVLNNDKLQMEIKAELKGRDLICCCAPKACHGDILLEIANAR